jgi:hypothetical protein
MSNGRSPADILYPPEPPKPEPGTVFVLGAGFSCAVSDSMPLLRELSPLVFAAYKDRDKIPTDIKKLLSVDLEEALSYLVQPKPWLRESEALRHRALFLELTYVIAEVLRQSMDDAVSRMTTGPSDWLKKLILYWHRHRCTVLTLNYDTLIETVAHVVEYGRDGSKPKYFSPWAIYPPFFTNAAMRSGALLLTKRPETFLLLKLHGSTNWFFSGRETAQGEPIYFIPPPGPPGAWNAKPTETDALCLAAVADKYPFIMPPVYDKAPLLTHETIRSIWFKGGEALKETKRVVFMGYRLPPTDRTMQHFLRSSLVDTGAAIEIVNQDSATITHYRELLSIDPSRISQSLSGPNCIPEFVASLKD